MEADRDIRTVEESDPAHLRRASDRPLPPGGSEHSLPLPSSSMRVADLGHGPGPRSGVLPWIGRARGAARLPVIGRADRRRPSVLRTARAGVELEAARSSPVRLTGRRPRPAGACCGWRAAAGLSAGLPSF